MDLSLTVEFMDGPLPIKPESQPGAFIDKNQSLGKFVFCYSHLQPLVRFFVDSSWTPYHISSVMDQPEVSQAYQGCHGWSRSSSESDGIGISKRRRKFARVGTSQFLIWTHESITGSFRLLDYWWNGGRNPRTWMTLKNSSPIPLSWIRLGLSDDDLPDLVNLNKSFFTLLLCIHKIKNGFTYIRVLIILPAAGPWSL